MFNSAPASWLRPSARTATRVAGPLATWHFELSGSAARRGLSQLAKQIAPVPLTGRGRACRLHIVMRTIPKNSDAALRARGLRLTGPRRVVLEVLRGSDAHPTAESVHRLVRRRLPRVSLGTVYRNLRLLVAEGLAAEIPGPHAEALRVRIAARTGLAITHHRIEFFGRCPQCRAPRARLHRPRRSP